MELDRKILSHLFIDVDMIYGILLPYCCIPYCYLCFMKHNLHIWNAIKYCSFVGFMLFISYFGKKLSTALFVNDVTTPPPPRESNDP